MNETTTKANTIRPPLKTHGGKWYLRQWLVNNLPVGFEDMNYFEVFAGGASFLLNKPPSRSEFLNDLDTDLLSVWMALQDYYDQFVERLSRWSYTEDSFKKAQEMKVVVGMPCTLEDLLDKATKEYVLRRMSRGGMKKNFAWSKRLRGGKPGDVNAWETMFQQLPRIHERIKNVCISNMDGKTLVESIDNPDNFLYLDPPYVKGTRSATKVYDHEMSDKDHEKLLDACLESPAKIMISGYQCPLYMRKLRDWNFRFRPVANHSSQRDRKPIKIEALWRNY